MRNKLNVWTITTIVGVLLEGWALCMVDSSPAHRRFSMTVKEEPAAHTLYEK